MQRTGRLAISLFGVLAAAAACAATPSRALRDAATRVVDGNSRFHASCVHPRDDPRRPDRMRLARRVAALPHPNAPIVFGYTPANALTLAVLADDTGLLRRLYRRGGRLDTPSLKSQAMYMAAAWDGPPMIEALARHGVSPDAHAAGRFTPLIMAATNNNFANVQTLLRLGADPNLRTRDGVSALSGAVACGNAALVRLLLEHGAKPDALARRIDAFNGKHLIDDPRPPTQRDASH